MDCARRTSRLLQGLAPLDPVFTQLVSTQRIRGKYVRQPVSPHENLLAGLFAKGVIRDSNRSIIHELGFNIGLMTYTKFYTSLRIHCGVYDSPRNGNGCYLQLPEQGPVTERLLNIPMIVAILRFMVECFEPDLGDAGFSSYRTAVSPTDYRLPDPEHEVNWIMYFSRAWGTVPPLPAPVRIEPVGNSGMLVILTPEPTSASNPEHLELGRQVRALLNKAGLLAWR